VSRRPWAKGAKQERLPPHQSSHPEPCSVRKIRLFRQHRSIPAVETHLREVRSSPDCVAKHPLRRLANRDSVSLRWASAGAAHDGSAGERARTIFLHL
jgi:hypothetical protein